MLLIRGEGPTAEGRSIESPHSVVEESQFRSKCPKVGDLQSFKKQFVKNANEGLRRLVQEENHPQRLPRMRWGLFLRLLIIALTF
jgi:hypothetical protein